ncbi:MULTISPECIES: hypothetical protein [Enterobacteriaceae]|uniref:hypothetical protein n=1 Tax=Enterobacteriaceae TaxID=543 RepID=UPI002FC7FE93
MSIDIYIQAVHEKDLGYFPLSVVDLIFAKAMTYRELSCNECSIVIEYPREDAGKVIECHDVRYVAPESSSAELTFEITTINNIAMVSGLSINRPPAQDDFWKSIFTLLTMTHSVLFTCGYSLIVGQAETIPHIIPDMTEALSAPCLVSNYHEMTSKLFEST